ncbi:uncharacterized protein AMSG_10191 [Thecamonas trahens ATCC 50062]|uniref:Pre-mRNA-processing factor 19 n=1 Tax=Thecamonas trahens ATCC 50062 TaxID=461836 RepID=A0A0L0DRJ5_THETB|nr:hypothetical protein AMSG_10191 [Thecamonas trahens ATCC 50062]KNC54949.1 hypothetical protein AMSG_10191 [Thecamonas trahens ATCC 50062]|eukprot:XP_013753399.1 hypothetical protein AMSG_10191 [Thecamonas trahens ATCC 50062]
MFCSLSNTVAKEPVVDPATGYVYEKRLIGQHLESDGRCPHTGNPLGMDQLIEVVAPKTAFAAPRPPSANSIPGMLAAFQAEWDAVMLESFQVKQALLATRQELAHALYKNDAAARVIARLVRERDEARAALTALNKSIPASLPTPATSGGAAGNGTDSGVAAMDVAGEAAPAPSAAAAAPAAGDGPADVFSPAEFKALSKAGKAVRKLRKKAVPPPDMATTSMVAEFAAADEVPLTHVFPADKGGISVAVPVAAGVAAGEHVASHGQTLVVGSGHGVVKIASAVDGSVVATLRGHKGRVTAAAAVADGASVVYTASSDGSARMWTRDESGSYHKTHLHNKVHNGAVTGVDVHHTGKLYVTSSDDGTLALYSASDGAVVTQKGAEARGGNTAPLHAVAFHPDGLILGAASEAGCVEIWSLQTMARIAELAAPAGAGSCTHVAFSEIGYVVAGGFADGTVCAFDLRNQQVFRVLRHSAPVSALGFDATGTYLAVGVGEQVAIYGSMDPAADDGDDAPEQSPAAIVTLNSPEGAATAVVFAPKAAALYVASDSGTVHVFTPQS